jgi:hypothetical protein
MRDNDLAFGGREVLIASRQTVGTDERVVIPFVQILAVQPGEEAIADQAVAEVGG